MKCCIKSREPEINSAEKICFYLEILLGDLCWIFACTYHLRWHFRYKSFGENYRVEFSVGHKTRFCNFTKFFFSLREILAVMDWLIGKSKREYLRMWSVFYTGGQITLFHMIGCYVTWQTTIGSTKICLEYDRSIYRHNWILCFGLMLVFNSTRQLLFKLCEKLNNLGNIPTKK